LTWGGAKVGCRDLKKSQAAIKPPTAVIDCIDPDAAEWRAILGEQLDLLTRHELDPRSEPDLDAAARLIHGCHRPRGMGQIGIDRLARQDRQDDEGDGHEQQDRAHLVQLHPGAEALDPKKSSFHAKAQRRKDFSISEQCHAVHLTGESLHSLKILFSLRSWRLCVSRSPDLG
jgi:hypothetical protein